MKVGVDALGSPSLIVCTVSVGVILKEKKGLSMGSASSLLTHVIK